MIAKKLENFSSISAEPSESTAVIVRVACQEMFCSSHGGDWFGEMFLYRLGVGF